MTTTPDTAPEHSELSPSKGYQWTQCTASVAHVRALEKAGKIPPDTAGPAAIEGTKAHTVGERLLLGQPLPPYVTKEMKDHAKAYVDYIREVKGLPCYVAQWGVEARVPLYYLPSDRGTVDFWCVNRVGIHLVDLKFGFLQVESIHNKQMAIYARSLVQSGIIDPLVMDVTRDTVITLTIFQPRLESEMVVWRTTWGEIYDFTEAEVTPATKLILSGGRTEFKASESICKFCRAKGQCEAWDQFLLKDFDEIQDFIDGEELPAPKLMVEPRLASIYLRREKLYSWIKAIEDLVEPMVLSGVHVDGLKVVLSKGPHRQWTDQPQAEKVLGELGVAWDDCHSVEFVTPAQAEGLIKGKTGKKVDQLKGLIVKPRGSPIVVPADDKRPAYSESPVDDFADL